MIQTVKVMVSDGKGNVARTLFLTVLSKLAQFHPFFKLDPRWVDFILHALKGNVASPTTLFQEIGDLRAILATHGEDCDGEATITMSCSGDKERIRFDFYAFLRDEQGLEWPHQMSIFWEPDADQNELQLAVMLTPSIYFRSDGAIVSLFESLEHVVVEFDEGQLFGPPAFCMRDRDTQAFVKGVVGIPGSELSRYLVSR